MIKPQHFSEASKGVVSKSNSLLLVITMLLLISCSQNQQREMTEHQSNPNIILILADDLGWSDLGCYGSEIATPNLDSLAFNGVRFTQFYNTAKCFPSRAALLTGRYAQEVGAGSSYKENWLVKTTIGSTLEKAGYTTFWSGKHHGPDHPVKDLGFGGYYGLWGGACNHFNPGNQRPGEPVPAQKRVRKWVVDGKVHEPYTPEDDDFYTTDAFTDSALDWLKGDRDQDKPFFLYLSYTAPHDPLMAWPEDISKYEDTYKVGYEIIQQARFKRQQKLGLFAANQALSTPTYTPWNNLNDAEKAVEAKKMAVYAAMIDRLDQNIGRLIDELKSSGEFENTLIIFLSDNGASAEVIDIPGNGKIGTIGEWTSLGQNWANVSNTPYRYYKNYSYEGGINTPAILHWPGKLQSGKIEKDMHGHFIDILPSLLRNVANVPVEMLDTIKTSGTGQLLGQDQKSDRQLFWEWQDGRAVRDGNWKLVVEGNGPWELYDLANDPFETNDLSGKYKNRVKQMEQDFLDWNSKVLTEATK